MSRAHPADANQALTRALIVVEQLIKDAEKRRDIAGADAWAVPKSFIEAAEVAMRNAREKQNWAGPGPQIVKPPRGVELEPGVVPLSYKKL